MITSTTLKNRVFLKNIRQALWLCKLKACKTNKRATEYVQNRHNRNVIRLDVYKDGSMSAYASGMGIKDISKMILKALDNV